MKQQISHSSVEKGFRGLGKEFPCYRRLNAGKEMGIWKQEKHDVFGEAEEIVGAGTTGVIGQQPWSGWQ